MTNLTNRCLNIFLSKYKFLLIQIFKRSYLQIRSQTNHMSKLIAMEFKCLPSISFTVPAKVLAILLSLIVLAILTISSKFRLPECFTVICKAKHWNHLKTFSPAKLHNGNIGNGRVKLTQFGKNFLNFVFKK